MEQPNLYPDMEKFKVTGKSSSEREEDAKEKILENKISLFIEDNKNDIKNILEAKGELGALDIHGLVLKFDGNASVNAIDRLRELFAQILMEKKFKLSGAVVRAEIQGRDSTLAEKKAKAGPEKREPKNITELDYDEIRKAREKLPPHQRGIPNADL